MTSPSNFAFGSMISRITDIIVTLLPEPDSPTMPSVSPSDTENETPSTARTRPSSVLKLTLRLFTSSSGSLMSLTNRPPSGRHQAGRTLGSSPAYAMSTSVLASTMKNAP